MLVTPSGIVILVRLVQHQKASIPDAGDAIRNRDARQAAAVGEGSVPMLVTGLPSMTDGMISSPDAFFRSQ